MKLAMLTAGMLGLLLGACAAPDHIPHQPPPPTHASRYVVPPDTRQTYEPSTQQFLQQEIERQSQRSPALQDPPVQQHQAQPQQPQERVIERTVYAQPYYHPQPQPRPFPWYTAWGAGIGAIIGHNHHHQTSEGAWIGAGVGMLLDMASYWHH